MNPSNKDTEDLAIWKEKFKITHFFVNPDGKASIQGLAYCLQETAVNHATAGKFGYEELLKRKQAWVLTRQHIRLKEIPGVSRQITIESWVSETRDSISVRDFHILDEKGHILGLARTSWMIFDLKTRRPVTIDPSLIKDFPHIPDRLEETLELDKIRPPETPAAKKTLIRVVYSDLDVNHHVNNIHYSRWVLDDFNYDFRTGYRLFSMENNFISEARYGDELLIATESEQEQENSFITTIHNRNDNRLILTSRTKWVNK